MAGNGIRLVLDVLFPPKCVFCEAILDHSSMRSVCPPCEAALPWLKERQAEQKLEFISLCVSALRYQDAVVNSIRRYKFKGREGYAATYGTLLAACVQAHLAGRYDRISWVPLSPARRRERGYDQAMLLAKAAALSLDSVAVETLRKVHHTEAQSSLEGESARRANVLDAYEVADTALFSGQRILLVDDVVTTGATLSECARLLRTFGATDVTCATLARAR